MSLWLYSPSKCDGDYCPGDCDICKKAEEPDTRRCAKCKHYVIKDSRSNWNGEEPTYIKGCELWECDFEEV